MLDFGMFGFFAPRQHIPEWRRSYARICQYQRKLFGLTSLPFLSYEATFLYQAAIDLKLLPRLPSAAPECCRLRRLRTQVSEIEDAAVRYAAAFGLTLVGVKLNDDVQDTGRLVNRVLERAFRARVKLAQSMITAMAPDVMAEIHHALQRHSEMERSVQKPPLANYVTPTADGFASAFGGMISALNSVHAANVCGTDLAGTDISGAGDWQQLSDIGRRVGQAIIAWDCAVDFDRDRITGNYNPLPDEVGVQKAFAYCLQQLAEIGWMLPEGSASSVVVAAVATRVRRRRLRPVAQNPLRRLERWGLVSEQKFAYARCGDGCDCVGGAAEAIGSAGEAVGGSTEVLAGTAEAVGVAAEVIVGAGEAAGGAAEADRGGRAVGGCGECCGWISVCPCFYGDLFACYSINKRPSNVAKLNEATADNPQGDDSDLPPKPTSPYAHFQDRRGVTSSDLVPTGFVTIDEQEIPARSIAGTVIPSGSEIRVVKADAFGVTVIAENE